MTVTDLVVIETIKAAELFTPGGVDRLLAKVADDVRAYRLDPGTEEGRSEIKSLAYKVARSKTALDDLGKDYVADMKKAAAQVDADRRTIRDRMDALRDEVRKPVDEWEATEKARVDAHVAAIEALAGLNSFADMEPSIEEIDTRLSAAAEFQTRDWEEFAERGEQLLAKVPAALQARRDIAVRLANERAELERFRKAEADRKEAEAAAQAARQRQEREDRIAADAAENVRRAADEAVTRAEQERIAAERRAQEAEAGARVAADKAERDRVAAAAQAERDQAAAVERERQRRAASDKAEADAAEARARNASHRGKVNRDIVAALTSTELNLSLSEAQAKAIVIAMATGKIPNATINY